MNAPILLNLQAAQQSWSRTLSSIVWAQWMVLDTSLEAAQRLLKSAVPAGPAVGRGQATPNVEGGPAELIRRAMERMKKGLAPPREVYQTPYRNQIDWSQFPDWARPIDPELFENSSHEG